jgi:tetratricopeptide (TPR) repeat protein
MPRFEKLSADYPSDMKPREAWAWCMMQYAATVPDKAQRKKIRARARTIAVQAKELGDNSQILQLMLEQPADGGDDVQFSDRKDIDDAMRAAEAEFARGDMDKAREGYLRVLLIDPNYYDAALFIGDVYYKQQVFGSAGEWFSRAIQIDPNRETAYRYWGDDLAAMGKENDARAKFIDAIVAEPYNNRSWIGLTNWVQRNKVQLNNVQLKQLSKVEVKDDKNVTLTLDANSSSDDPNSVAWMTYGMALAAWRTDEYRKKFPDVPRNRRTLQEEAHALDLMTTVLKEQKNYQEMYKRLDPSLQSLIKIKEAGFLEPFVLINRADAEIAQDYEAYRKDNRELIRRYFDEFVVPKTPSAAAQD